MNRQRIFSAISLGFFVFPLYVACGTPSGERDGDANPNDPESGKGDIDLGDDEELDVTEQPPTANCADSLLDSDEACDDGNMNSGDGCASNCRYVEPGYVCPDAGEPCRQFAKCGDGAKIFPEQCDDGALEPGDGCSETCKLEIGWKCDDATPSVCSRTLCGDNIVEGAETCDDSNSLPFDGCSQTCQGEPICTANGCTTTCGDGINLAGEECDDGNTLSGDGCSATCTVETDKGYSCEQATRCPDGLEDCPLDLPIIFRDFNVAHSDFHAPEPYVAGQPYLCDGFAPNMVESALNPEGKPTFISAPATACVSNLHQWYVDTDQSSTILGSVRLYPNGNGGYVNRFGAMGEPYLTAVKTASEQHAGATLAACETSCAARARDGQPPFTMADGHLRCDDLCRDVNQSVSRLRDDDLNQATIRLTNAEAAAVPDEVLIAEIEAEIADIETQILAAEAAADACETDCATKLEARTAFCAAQCGPCSDDPAAYCIGGELLELDGDPTFFPIDGHPDALDDTRYEARIPAQIYRGLGWPWEGGGTNAAMPTGPKHNFHFTTEIAYWFTFSDGLTADLTFLGDDDVWVFVNRKLVIDLGGIHVPLGGQFTINADGSVDTRTWQAVDPGVATSVETELDSTTTTTSELGLIPGNVYEIKVFHAERKPEGSSFQLTLSGFEGSRSECKAVCGDGLLAAGEQCDLGKEMNVGGHNGCKGDCTLDAYCGDGVVEEGLEQCDDADPAAPGSCSGCRLLVVR